MGRCSRCRCSSLSVLRWGIEVVTAVGQSVAISRTTGTRPTRVCDQGGCPSGQIAPPPPLLPSRWRSSSACGGIAAFAAPLRPPRVRGSRACLLASPWLTFCVSLLPLPQESNRIYLVLEHCAGGDLSAYIRRWRRVGEPFARRCLRQLAAGLRELRRHNLVHVSTHTVASSRRGCHGRKLECSA